MPESFLSIVVPAFNEEKCIVDCLRSIRSACEASLPGDRVYEIVVVDNNSTDRTAELARGEGARVVFEPKNQIARARNCGAEAASGQWLIFLDADSLLTPELLADTIGLMDSGKVIGGGTIARFPGAALYVRFWVGAWNLISRTMKWACGAYVFCLAEAFRQTGGFPEEYYVSEEIYLSQNMKRLARARGKRFVIQKRHPVLSSDRKVHLYGRFELLFSVFRLLISPRKSVRDPKRCFTWYDGKR